MIVKLPKIIAYHCFCHQAAVLSLPSNGKTYPVDARSAFSLDKGDPLQWLQESYFRDGLPLSLPFLDASEMLMLEASETMLLIATIFPPRHSDVVWWSLVERSTKWTKRQGFGLGPSFPPASIMRKEISKKCKTAKTCKTHKKEKHEHRLLDF